MKKLLKRLTIISSFIFLFLGKDAKAMKSPAKSSLGNDQLNSLDKRINGVRERLKEQLKDKAAQKTLLEIKKYTAGTEWINWGNWGNWNNWNNWTNWDQWAKWANQWSNWLNENS
jgi:hypothetical protein